MGNRYSEPIPETPNFDYVAVCIRQHNHVLLLHAPQHVIQNIESILREVNITCTGKDVCNSRKKEIGYHKLTFSKSWVFHPRNRGDQGLSGKLFMLRLLEEMYKMGYDPIVSSDLVSRVDNSTVFFRKEQ